MDCRKGVMVSCNEIMTERKEDERGHLRLEVVMPETCEAEADRGNEALGVIDFRHTLGIWTGDQYRKKFISHYVLYT